MLEKCLLLLLDLFSTCCVCACVRVCMRVYVCVCVRACVCRCTHALRMILLARILHLINTVIIIVIHHEMQLCDEGKVAAGGVWWTE